MNVIAPALPPGITLPSSNRCVRRPITRAHALGMAYLFVILSCWWLFHIGIIFYMPDWNNPNVLAAIETGSVLNQIDVVFFGLIGIAALVPAVRLLSRVRCSWPYWLLAYLLWSTVSLMWSQDVLMGSKRLVTLYSACIGAIGIGAGFYGRLPNGPSLLLRHVRIAGLITIPLCIPRLLTDLTIANLTAASWRSGIREAGPEVGFSLAYALIAYFALRSQPTTATHAPRRRYYLSVLGIVALLALLLIWKSRSLIVFTAVIALALYMLTRRKSRNWVASAVISLAIIVALAPLFVIYESTLYQFFARGDSAQTINQLNGRQPLWEYVWNNDVTQRPWMGVGFGSYWTTTRAPAVWHAIGWRAPHAHNGYLDELAATGAIGLLLFSGFIVSCFTAMARRTTGPGHLPTIVAAAWVVLFLLINCTDTVLQFYFKVPFIFTLAAVASCSVAVSPGYRSQPKHLTRSWGYRPRYNGR